VLEGEPLRITVIDEDRHPVAGARVWSGPSWNSVGTFARSGEDGVAVLAKPSWELGFVMASAAGRFGRAQILVEFSGGEARVTLFPDADVIVRAVDPTGVPRTGVPMLDLGPAPGRGRLLSTDAVRTDEQGLAVLRNVLVDFQARADARELVVGPAGLFREPLTVALPRAELPREPVDIVVPPSGSLWVEVRRADGSLNTEATSVQIALDPEPGHQRGVPELTGLMWNHTRTVLIAPLEEGRAEIPQIGLGLDLVAWAPGVDPMDSTFGFAAGPTSADERTLLTLRPLAEPFVIAGVALDALGRVVANTPLKAGVTTERERFRPSLASVLWTDASGRFHFVLQAAEVEAWRAGLGLRIELVPQAGSPLALARAWAPLSALLAPGENDAGSLVLEEEPPLWVGAAYGEDGRGVSLSRVWLESSDDPVALEPLSLLVAAEQFAVFAEPSLRDSARAAGLSLVVDAEGFARQRFDLLAGQPRATIALHEAASLHGQLHSSSNEFLFLFEVAAFSRDSEGRRLGHGWTRAAQNGRFRLEGLPRRACELEVRNIKTHDEMAYRVGVRPGSPSSAQQAGLDAIRVDRPLFHFEVRVVGDGEGLASATFSSAELGEDVRCLRDGWLSLWSPNASVTGELRAPGFRPREVTLLPGESFETLAR
jgi:hypothetical protein